MHDPLHPEDPFDQPTTADAPFSQDRSSSGALVPGSILAGRYEILKMLGEGGIGAVYKAMDRELRPHGVIPAIKEDARPNKISDRADMKRVNNLQEGIFTKKLPI